MNLDQFAEANPMRFSMIGAACKKLAIEGTAITKAVVKSIDAALDLDLDPGGTPSWVDRDQLRLNDIGRVRLALASPLPIDDYREHRATGAFILVDADDGWTLGAAMAGPTSITAGLTAPTHLTSANSNHTGTGAR